MPSNWTPSGNPMPGLKTLKQRVAYVAKVRAGFEDKAVSLSHDLYTGKINLDTWERYMRREITAMHTASLIISRGGDPKAITPADLKALNGAIKGQYKYLAGFKNAIGARAYLVETGKGDFFSEQYLANRSRLYGGPAGATFYRSFSYNLLPQVPRDGNTQCKCITTPDSRILTKRGLVPISMVAVGDMVMTHRNRWRRVTKVLVHQSSPTHSLAIVNAPSGRQVGFTSDHRLLTQFGWQTVEHIETYGLNVYTVKYEHNLQNLREEYAGPLGPNSRITSTPKILLSGVLRQGTSLYDIEVEEDHSFVVEGIVAHNSNCKCELEFRQGNQPETVEIRWLLRPAEHCGDCVSLNAKWNPYVLHLPEGLSAADWARWLPRMRVHEDESIEAGLDLAAATPEARSEAARKSWLTRKRKMEEQGKAGGARGEKVEPPSRPPREISFTEMRNALMSGLKTQFAGGGQMTPDAVFDDLSNKAAAKKEIAKRLMLHSAGKITSDDAAHITDVWAGTSADNNTQAILLQKKAHDVFGEGGLDPYISEKYNNLGYEDANLSWGHDSKHSRFMPVKEVVAKQELYLKSMQRNTQRWFKEHGMEPDDEITLYRGYSTKDSGRGPDWTIGKEIKVTANPMTSWSLSGNVASIFGSGSYGVVLKRRVKIREIVGMCRSGLGCLEEQEFVLANQHGRTATIELMG